MCGKYCIIFVCIVVFILISIILLLIHRRRNKNLQDFIKEQELEEIDLKYCDRMRRTFLRGSDQIDNIFEERLKDNTKITKN